MNKTDIRNHVLALISSNASREGKDGQLADRIVSFIENEIQKQPIISADLERKAIDFIKTDFENFKIKFGTGLEKRYSINSIDLSKKLVHFATSARPAQIDLEAVFPSDMDEPYDHTQQAIKYMEGWNDCLKELRARLSSLKQNNNTEIQGDAVKFAEWLINMDYTPTYPDGTKDYVEWINDRDETFEPFATKVLYEQFYQTEQRKK